MIKREDNEDYHLSLTLLSEDKKDIKRFLSKRNQNYINDFDQVNQYIEETTTQCYKLISGVETIREEMKLLLHKGDQSTKKGREENLLLPMYSQTSLHLESSSSREESSQLATQKESEFKRLLYQRNKLRSEVQRLKAKAGKKKTLNVDDFDPIDYPSLYNISKKEMPGQIEVRSKSLIDLVKKLQDQRQSTETRISILKKTISKYDTTADEKPETKEN